jgi:succinyl-CoA synthetase beta subunit
MKLMEYQGKELFKKEGIPVPKSGYAATARDVAAFILANPGSWVLKSQVLAGGRGKAGGIKFAENAEQAEPIAEALLKLVITNSQAPEGEAVRSILVEERLAIKSEAYLAITTDRATKRPVFIVSAKGGMDIEEVSESDPGAITKVAVNPAIGFQPFVARRLAFEAKLPLGYHKAFPKIAEALYRLYFNYGANLVEINPLVLTKDGQVFASDAKVELDDNGLFKHPELAEWKSDLPANEDETTAVAIGLGMSNYARLDGTVGLIANGAGLGMGTMDAIRNAGGQAANFLDIGGGAQAELVKRCYGLVVGNPKVRSVFINIFGGITRGDQVAFGIVGALRGDDVRRVPLVVRLTGTNEKEGRSILAEAGMNPVETMDEGAALAVELARA